MKEHIKKELVALQENINFVQDILKVSCNNTKLKEIEELLKYSQEILQSEITDDLEKEAVYSNLPILYISISISQK